eukprot:gnl/TRDRNA2_/TRDRNA2_82794_c0_seq2.p1 gnl/TRDRNA2_/TRDRNA2_82794_c0~~gnl/TRDRNA2_/TRDRNA2_82794_c0_seq2.p1  ORF type:complete len:230 (+),score=38.74 gnl/TRDRNA2_/TRDRNA2_82794_c0_seq2:83-772(+)
MADAVPLVARSELGGDISICRCHPEDAIRWGFYSGDYVRITCSTTAAFAIVNPPANCDSDSDEGDAQKANEMQPAEGQGLWIAAALHSLLHNAAVARLEVSELEEAALVRVAGATRQSLAAAEAFFGTTSATRGAGTLQDVAVAEDLDVGAEAVQFWQGYVDASRCRMRPVWPGLPVALEEHLRVESILGSDGEFLEAGIVGPRTRIEGALTAKMQTATVAAPSPAMAA